MTSRGAIMLEDLAVTREAWLRSHNKPVKHKVSPHERESLHKWFSILDDDGSGSIDKKELDTGMRRLTSLPKEDVQDLKRMMKRFDTESTDFETFVSGMSRADPAEVMKDAAEREAEKRQTALLMMTYNRKRLVELFCDKEKRRLLDLEEPVSSLPDATYDMSLAESQADPLRPGLNSMSRFVKRRPAPCITQAQRRHRLQESRQGSLTSRPQASFCFRHYQGLNQTMESKLQPNAQAGSAAGEPESLVSAVDTSSGRVFIKNYKQKDADAAIASFFGEILDEYRPVASSAGRFHECLLMLYVNDASIPLPTEVERFMQTKVAQRFRCRLMAGSGMHRQGLVRLDTNLKPR